MKPLRIALFTYSTKPRGGVIHTLELAEALQAGGQEVCVYALTKDSIGFHRSLSCPSKLVPTKPAPESIDKLIEQRINEFIEYLSRDEEKYDIYHSQDCISANALKAMGEIIPHFIRTVHHIDQFNSPYLQDCHDRSIYEADLCLCVSQHWQQELYRQYHIHAPVVNNGININRFSSQANGLETELKQRLNITQYPVYLTIGGIEPRKNSLQLLQAFIKVLNHYPEAQLIIAGGETLFDYQAYRDEFFVQAEAAKINIGKSLILPGVLTDQEISVLYRCANAFVFPSVKEGWGLVLLEAIASRLSVITSNIAPFTEFLTQEQALLVDPSSSEAIAQAMLEVLKDDIIQKIVNNSYCILSEYSWEKSAEMHLNLYQKLISTN